MSVLLIVLRVILLIAPIVAVIAYLRWRSLKKSEGADLDKELRVFRIRLTVIILFVLLAIAGLKLFNDDRAGAGADYTPPVFKDGKIVPGTFKDRPNQQDQQDQNLD